MQPKLWDWDGMDNDFNSVSNSTQGGAAPALMPAANNASSNLRPTTAAAIAMDNDMLMGARPALLYMHNTHSLVSQAR
jgi:hypothetical protein